MKIVCDSCGTKYSIADEKVRGKVFKIRCKKCSHIIVVRGGEGQAEAAAPAAEGGWHLVVDGEQVGPMPDADVRARVERGEVKADTYVWRDGFADWMKLAVVPEFAGLFGEDVSVNSGPANVDPFVGPPAVTNGAERSRRQSTGRNSLFGPGGGEDADVFAAPAPAPGGGDLFASRAAQAPVEEPRWPSAGAPAAGHDGGRVESLTGQRHENSVLFSLSNLQSLAMPSAAPAGSAATAAVPEGSGLIDIRAMAASTLGAGGGRAGAGDDLPVLGTFSPAAPVLLQLPSSSGPPVWIYPLILVMVLLVGGIAVMAWKVMTVKAPTVVEIAPPAPAAVEPAKPTVAVAEPAAGKPSTIPEDKLPPREGDATEAKAERAAGKAEHEHHHGGRAGKEKEGKEARDGKKGSSSDDKEKKSAALAAAEPVVPKPAKGSIDDLLDGAVTKKSGRARGGDDDPSKRSSDSSNGPLSKGAVVAGMNSAKPKIAECYNEYRVPGMAMVNVVIGKSGRVSSAAVTGKFAGTPTGSCVEKAVKAISFPPSDGLSTPYPFQLK